MKMVRLRIITTSLILAAFAFITVFFGWLDVAGSSADGGLKKFALTLKNGLQ